MSINAWECPRCHRINAPTTGFCGCQQSFEVTYNYSNKTVTTTTNKCLQCNADHPINIPCLYSKVTQ